MGGGQVDSVMSVKMENDAASFIRSLAQKRQRNAEWAERAVRQSVSASDDEALALGVVELVAPTCRHCANARRRGGALVGRRTLSTRAAPLRTMHMGWRDRVLSAIANPNIAYLLLMLGAPVS